MNNVFIITKQTYRFGKYHRVEILSFVSEDTRDDYYDELIKIYSKKSHFKKYKKMFMYKNGWKFEYIYTKDDVFIVNEKPTKILF